MRITRHSASKLQDARGWPERRWIRRQRCLVGTPMVGLDHGALPALTIARCFFSWSIAALRSCISRCLSLHEQLRQKLVHRIVDARFGAFTGTSNVEGPHVVLGKPTSNGLNVSRSTYRALVVQQRKVQHRTTVVLAKCAGGFCSRIAWTERKIQAVPNVPFRPLRTRNIWRQGASVSCRFAKAIVTWDHAILCYPSWRAPSSLL